MKGLFWHNGKSKTTVGLFSLRIPPVPLILRLNSNKFLISILENHHVHILTTGTSIKSRIVILLAIDTNRQTDRQEHTDRQTD